MRRRGGLTMKLALLVVGWIALAAVTAGGPEAEGFHKAVAQGAQEALSAVRTARLAGQAGLDGRAVKAYLEPVLDGTLHQAASAAQRLAVTPPPGPAAAGTRDELAALLDEADGTIGDLVAAVHRDDRPRAQAAVAALGPIGDRLAGFIQRHQL